MSKREYNTRYYLVILKFRGETIDNEGEPCLYDGVDLLYITNEYNDAVAYRNKLNCEDYFECSEIVEFDNTQVHRLCYREEKIKEEVDWDALLEMVRKEC